MDVITEVKKLKFPTDQYIVVGSGHLAVLRLKEVNDIDIVVTPELFEKCKKSGWEQIPWTYPDKLGHIFLRKGYVELYLDVNKGDFNPSFSELKSGEVVIDGVPLVSLEDLLKFKKEYSKVNSKHLEDAILIKSYLNID